MAAKEVLSNEDCPQSLVQQVKDSALFISEHAKDVTINPAAIQSTAEWLAKCHQDGGAFELKRWRTENPLHWQEASKECVQWIFLIDTLNFSFWNDDDSRPYTVAYRGQHYRGYWSLCAAINRALEEGHPLLDAAYLRDISVAQVKHIFRSTKSRGIESVAVAVEDGDKTKRIEHQGEGETKAEEDEEEDEQIVPLLVERTRHLNEIGKTLLEHFNGHFAEVVKAAKGSALELVQLVYRYFPCYRDAGLFGERPVFFLKRVQILVADLWAAFEGINEGAFHDIDQLTMFADYRVPQTLVALGCIQYSPRLLELLNSKQLLAPACQLEMEIRGCSIWAVELIRNALLALLPTPLPAGSHVNAITIDFYLWDYAKLRSADLAAVPIHRTRSTFY